MAQVRPFPQPALAESQASGRLWGVVLAGADAARVTPHDNVVALGRRPSTEPAAGDTSRLSRTLERVAKLLPPERVVAVFARADSARCERELRAAGAIRRMMQPHHRGSAAETFLPVLKIARLDPEAVVAVLPTHHVAFTDADVIETVARAAGVAALRPDLAVLVGAASRRPDATYGWVEPGDPLPGLEEFEVRAVRRFVHAPLGGSPPASTSLLSTPAIVARATTLLDLGRRYLPDVLETLEPLERALGVMEERLLCDAVYECMPYASVARELLERGDGFAVLPTPGALRRESATEAMLLAS